MLEQLLFPPASIAGAAAVSSRVYCWSSCCFLPHLLLEQLLFPPSYIAGAAAVSSGIYCWSSCCFLPHLLLRNTIAQHARNLVHCAMTSNIIPFSVYQINNPFMDRITGLYIYSTKITMNNFDTKRQNAIYSKVIKHEWFQVSNSRCELILVIQSLSFVF